MEILFFILVIVFAILLWVAFLYYIEQKKRITLTKFLNRISITAQEVRYGNLSRRLRSSLTPETKWIAENINRMIETLTDRELMIKAYQMELEQQKKHLEELVSIQEDFTATLTHDLKVPILAEINALKLFSEESFGQITEKQKNVIVSMLNNNEELLFLVNTLLDTCKNRSGNLKIVKEKQCLLKAAKESIDEVAFLVKKHTVTLNCDMHRVDAKFDKIEIKRVLKNLLNNAISYTKQDGIIDVKISKNDEFVEVSVLDNGRGISSEDLDNVFEKYFSTAKKMRKVGTGLGLYLSKQIIEKHGGKIWVESEINKGSAFHFKLPV
ncbi:MAG: HAMP domain-containing sensor histidine kinase [bacterium]